MPLGSILLVSALAFVVLLYLSNPFLSGNDLGARESAERSSLLAERERLLAAILELENDYEMGKVPEEVFEVQRKTLTSKGADVLQALEKHKGADQDAELESLIANHKKKKSQ